MTMRRELKRDSRSQQDFTIRRFVFEGGGEHNTTERERRIGSLKRNIRETRERVCVREKESDPGEMHCKNYGRARNILFGRAKIMHAFYAWLRVVN